MNRWLWYVGWLVVWFLALALIFVPLANLFSGALRILMLIAAVAVLLVGFGFLYRRLRAHAPDHARARDPSRPAAHKGMSEREARIVAEARAQVYGDPPGHQSDAIPALPLPVSGVAPTKPDAVSDAVRESMNYELTGVMRSAANPLVRSAYAQAMREVETKTYESGLWAMALVECNGDEKMARLAYMKARASDLAWTQVKAAESTQGAARLREGKEPRPASDRAKPTPRR